LRHAAEAFPEIRLNPDIWLTPPRLVHRRLPVSKSDPLAETAGALAEGATEQATWAMRRTFFEEARDVARWEVQCGVGEQTGLDIAPIEALIHDGSAFAALASDYHDAVLMGVKGSPSFVLNDGRQKLYGNVGFRNIEANIQELLREPKPEQASLY
jgi:predicted DsbA family dithiol-disulfide isomerase